ncbi:MAG: hypothetical protein M3O70_11185 [Actinomycetota bacterium]|nr:hypothetical protein [Actinomycetota bacterium]
MAAHGFTQKSVRALWYVVVEEIVDGVAGLTVSAWPYADQAGRLRFQADDTTHDSFEVSIPLTRLRSELYAGFVERDPRIGDVFAMRLDPSQEAGPRRDRRRRWNRSLGRLFIDVYDISAEARKVAKLAFYASVADAWTHEQATDHNLLEGNAVAADRDDGEAAPRHPRLRFPMQEPDHGQ